MEQAGLWAIAAGVFNGIPYFGPVIGAVGAAVVAFLQFGTIPMAMIVAPSSPTATILSVGFGQCRWPYGCSGEAGFGLCGRSVARGAFCAAHAEVGYQKRSCTAESLLRMVVD